MSKKILVLNDAFNEQHRDKIRETAAPYGYEVHFFENEEAALAEASGAEIIYGFGIALVRAAKDLKWLHMSWAGVDGYLKARVVPDDVLFSNSAGTYGVTIAEHVVMTALMLMREQMFYGRAMDQRDWQAPRPQKTLKDARITMLGAGDIGTTTARRLKAFEPASITAVNRTGHHDDPVFDAVYPQTELERVLPETDLLVMSLPSTAATQGILNKHTLSLLPSEALVINVGRGTAVVEEDLVEALKAGTIAGAALDVFSVEPVPADSPLWDTPHLLMTPHIAGNLTAPYTTQKNVDMFCEDLVNYCEGRKLKYEVDRQLGY
ncbi:MAG: D-2-hydroxyacid dehydrogenase [Lachnospiraceae bacterium]|nr:D-2-hydroxyacid dehydrogenase [Lachnospiraceae bacterium]